jgi:hypothetical protein
LSTRGGGKIVRVREDAQAGEPLLVVQGPDGIAANTVERYRVRVRSLSPDNVKGGQLVATADDAAPASLDVCRSRRRAT